MSTMLVDRSAEEVAEKTATEGSYEELLLRLELTENLLEHTVTVVGDMGRALCELSERPAA